MKTLITIVTFAITFAVLTALVGCTVRPARPQSRELECFGAAGDGEVCMEWAEYREAMGDSARAEVLRLHAERSGVTR